MKPKNDKFWKAGRIMEDEVAFKGTRDGLLLIIKEHLSFPLIKEKLLDKLRNSGNFFVGAAVQIEIGEKILQEKEAEEVKTMVESFGLLFDGFIVPEEKKTMEEDEMSRQAVKHMTNSLLIKKTLRSGQRVNYDGNIIIMGDVNPGAEVVAAGDIVVLGKLKGIAHAGASGNQAAIVMAFHLQPIQLRIAQHITRSPDNEEISLIPTSPEIAKVKEGLVVIEPY